MKAINMLLVVLAVMGGRAYAADFTDLQTFNIAAAKAAAAEGAATEYVAVEKLSVKQALQPVMLLNIKAKDGIKLSAKAVYLSSSNSFFCTHASFSDGSLERLPNILEKAIAVTASGEVTSIKIDRTLNDSCRSQLKGLSLQATHPKITPDLSKFDVLQSDTDQDALVQKVLFKKRTSPYIGVFYAPGTDTILVGPNGVANAEVSLQE